MYNCGEGVEQDFSKAMEWYEKAYELGSSAAAENLGYMYLYGEGVEINQEKANEWFDKAEELK